MLTGGLQRPEHVRNVHYKRREVLKPISNHTFPYQRNPAVLYVFTSLLEQFSLFLIFGFKKSSAHYLARNGNIRSKFLSWSKHCWKNAFSKVDLTWHRFLLDSTFPNLPRNVNSIPFTHTNYVIYCHEIYSGSTKLVSLTLIYVQIIFNTFKLVSVLQELLKFW